MQLNECVIPKSYTMQITGYRINNPFMLPNLQDFQKDKIGEFPGKRWGTPCLCDKHKSTSACHTASCFADLERFFTSRHGVDRNNELMSCWEASRRY